MKYPQVIFRADGNNNIGMGHVIRCLALAEMLREKFTCTFAIVNPMPELQNTILSTCHYLMLLTDENIHTFTSSMSGKEIVVLDGYQFTSEHQQAIKGIGCKLVRIDDLHNEHQYADVVINHAITASTSMYEAETYTRILTGSNWILLRKVFLDAAAIHRKESHFHHAFVCFGGADKEEMSYQVCQLLNHMRSIHVLHGAAYTGDLQRFDLLAREKQIPIHVHQNLKPEQVLEVMKACDIAFVAASGIAYECAAAGLPMVTGYTMNHQQEFYDALCRQPNVIGVEAWAEVNATQLRIHLEELRNNYHPEKPSFVDGRQPERYLSLFTELAA